MVALCIFLKKHDKVFILTSITLPECWALENEDEKKKEKIREKCEYYSWKKIAEDTENVYRKL